MTQNASSLRIKRLILMMIITILFTVTALTIQRPTSTYAALNNSTNMMVADTGGGSSTNTTTTTNYKIINGGALSDLEQFEANQAEASGHDSVSKLYWNSTRHRSGVEIYIVDADGNQLAKQVYFDKSWADDTGQDYINYFNNGVFMYYTESVVAHAGDSTALNSMGNACYLDNITTVGYSTESYSLGSNVMSWLIADSGYTLEVGTSQYILPNWAYLVCQSGNEVELTKFLEADSKDQNQWHVFVEPVTMCFIYTSDTFEEDTPAPVWCGFEDNMWKKGDPKPAGSDEDGVWIPRVFACDSVEMLASIKVWSGSDNGNSHTEWLLQRQLPFSLTLANDVEVKTHSFGFGLFSTNTVTLSACKDTDVRTLSYTGRSMTYIEQGIGIACLEIDAFKDPIHTYWESNGTPGDPEPTGDNSGGSGGGSGGGKSGTSKIYKHYYTVTTTYDSDGTTVKDLKVEKEDTRHEDNTTDFISVDDFTTAKELFIFLQFLRNMVYTCDC
jgi:hypothetical protein